MAELQRFQIRTNGNGFYDITREVCACLARTGVSSGLAVVFCPHTTAGITINENADPDVVSDLKWTFDTVFPKRREYRHGEGNSDAHVKSTLTGASLTVIVEGGRPLLGTWQGIYFAEYDGPRTRTCYVKAVEG